MTSDDRADLARVKSGEFIREEWADLWDRVPAKMRRGIVEYVLQALHAFETGGRFRIRWTYETNAQRKNDGSNTTVVDEDQPGDVISFFGSLQIGSGGAGTMESESGPPQRLEFRANDGGFSDKWALICGVIGADDAGSGHYLNLSRASENDDPRQDWGVHCEFDNQNNGRHNCVRRCRLSRSHLEVELTEAIRQYIAISVDISSLNDAAFDAMRQALPRLFRGSKGILEIEVA